jgi:glycosyltransferase involved in cell wall biosynthesis
MVPPRLPIAQLVVEPCSLLLPESRTLPVKICMFVKNSFEYDARVTKEAVSLIEAGHEVLVVAIHVPKVTAEHEVRTDGIEVRRVSRVSFGVGALNQLASRYAGSIEERNARLTGDEVDEDRIRSMSQVLPESTATPGANQNTVRNTPTPATKASRPTARLWGRVSTPVLRFVARAARFAVRSLKFLLGRQGRALKTYAINKRMIKIGVASGADVFHSHDLNTLYVGATCKKRTPGARLVYDSHELHTERNRMGYWWRKWAVWNEKKWLPSADAMIVASPSWIAEIEKKTGWVPRNSASIVNTPPLREHVPQDLRGELDIPTDQAILLYQGSIQENRGIEPAIDAVATLDGCVLVVVGYGYHRTSLEADIRARGLENKVKFFGPIPNDELLDWTAAADIGMCNIINSSLSYYTSLPNKLFEYMMAGIAVIGSDSPEIGRIVAAEGVGVVCDPADPVALADASRTILRDLERYKAASRDARMRHHWGLEGRKLIDLYANLPGG